MFGVPSSFAEMMRLETGVSYPCRQGIADCQFIACLSTFSLHAEILLMLLQVKQKPKLSAEEARKQAEEVLRKAREKREVRDDSF